LQAEESERNGAAPRLEKVVLLAPACASFDMFRDYAERGRVFKKEVAKLAELAERRVGLPRGNA
jgi:UDP-N-acetylmuramoylalanine-D-glutamate ligase